MKKTIFAATVALTASLFAGNKANPDALKLWDTIGENYKRVCKKG